MTDRVSGMTVDAYRRAAVGARRSTRPPSRSGPERREADALRAARRREGRL